MGFYHKIYDSLSIVKRISHSSPIIYFVFNRRTFERAVRTQLDDARSRTAAPIRGHHSGCHQRWTGRDNGRTVATLDIQRGATLLSDGDNDDW